MIHTIYYTWFLESNIFKPTVYSNLTKGSDLLYTLTWFGHGNPTVRTVKNDDSDGSITVHPRSKHLSARPSFLNNPIGRFDRVFKSMLESEKMRIPQWNCYLNVKLIYLGGIKIILIRINHRTIPKIVNDKG